jgi:hypothetical protein
MTSLKWGKTERFKGILNRCASLVYIMLSIRYNIFVVSSIHVAGVKNILHDKLSRGVTPQELGYQHSEIMELQEDTLVLTFMQLCNPHTDIETYERFKQFWIQIENAMNAL